MPDTITEGFGANTPVALATATVDILCRIIAAPPDGFVRIRGINFAIAQTGGAFVATVAVPVFILRGNANLGVSAAAGGGLVIPLRPTSPVLPGLPDIGQIVGGLELLYATYFRLGSSGAGIVFPQDDEHHVDIVARDTQKLAICIAPLVDITTATPVFIAAGTTGASLSVMGSQGRLSKTTQLPGSPGETRSLPRFDVEHSDARNQ